jgi:hypothetical protein
MNYSVYADPDLNDWLRWASESGETPNFIRTIAEAAFLADSPHYALLRPVLLELKRQRPCPICGVQIKRLKRHLTHVHTKSGYDQAAHEVKSITGKTRIVKPRSVKALQGGLPDTNRKKH